MPDWVIIATVGAQLLNLLAMAVRSLFLGLSAFAIQAIAVGGALVSLAYA